MKRNKIWFVIAILVISALLLVACEDVSVPTPGEHTHTYGAWTLTTAPTATTDGSATRTCACGEDETVTVANLTNTDVWTVSVSQDATHVSNGYTVYTSTYGTVTTTSNQGQHTYGDWTITKDPTETETGSAIKICTCGHSVVEDVPVLSNNIWTKDDSNRPSHDAAGSVVYTSNYGTVTVVVPAGAHSFGNWTNNNDGTHTRTCDCGEDETDAHVFDQRIANSNTKKADATCTTGAKYAYSCVCGAVSTVDTFFNGEGTGHVFSEFTLTKEPTCTETGLASVKCTNCDYENDNSVIAALGHKWSTTYYPYYGSSQYWDADTGEVIVDEDTASEFHAHACTVCGIFDQDNKVEHAYGDEYLVAEKYMNFTQMSTKHACVCGYTEDVNDNLGYLEKVWTKGDEVPATYNNAGSIVYTKGDYTYTLAVPKLVAPYDSKTYYFVEVYLSDNATNPGATSIYSRNTAYITLDANGEGVGVGGYPVAGANKVTMVDATTGEIIWKIADTEYKGYVDMSNGIVVISKENPFTNKVLIGSWLEDGALKIDAFAGSVWGANMAVSYKHNCSIGKHEFNIYINEDGVVTFGVDFVDANGTAISAGEVHTANYVKIAKDGKKLVAFAKNSNGTLVEADGYEGTYTADLGSGNETIVLDGCGTFTAGTKSGTYTLVEGKSYTADMYQVVDNKNVAYYQITIANGTLTAVKPMATIKYETDHGTVGDSSVNTNIKFTLPTWVDPVMEGDKEYVFAGWKLKDATEDDGYITEYTPTTSSVTFVATWTQGTKAVTIIDAQGESKTIRVGTGFNILDAAGFPAYNSDTIKNGYLFNGWYIDNNKDGVIDEEEDLVGPTTTVSADITVIAAWEWVGNVTFTEQTNYAWEYVAETNSFRSANWHVGSSTSTMQINWASGTTVIEFDYWVTSEQGYDYLTIWYYNDLGERVSILTKDNDITSGNAVHFKATLTGEGQHVQLSYSKDVSTDADEDRAFVVNLTINGIPVASQQPLNKDIAGTYTSGDTTVVVGAGGLVTVDGATGSYTILDTNKIGVTLADGDREITLNKANGTCTIVTPQVTVSYNYGGHGTNTTTTVNRNATITLPTDLTADGYAFVGWYTDAEFTTKVDTPFKPSANTDLYARWVVPSPFAGTYTMLIFNKDGTGAGSFYNSDTERLVIDALGNGIVTSYNGFTNGYAVSISFVEGSNSVVTITAGSPSSTYRTSYYGVYDAASGVIVRASGLTGFDTTVYMMVPYNANYAKEDFAMFAWKDGSTYRKLISFADRNAETETTRTIFIESATNVAFGITSWSAKDKTYTAVENLANVSAKAVMFTVTAGETTYSYAKNSSDSFVALTDELQGKYTNGDDYVVLSGVGVIYFKDGKAANYTVAEDGAISALTSTANYTITLDTSAKTFTKADNKVTINYYDGETELTDKQAAPYSGIKYTLIAGPKKEGYVFRGWYENADFSGSKVTSVTPTGDKTYYAKYDAAVTLTFDYNGYTDGETSSHSVTGKFVNDTVGTLPTVLNDAKYGTKVFVGWFTANGTDGNWGDQVTTSTILTETTTTYYAKWIEPHAMMGTYKGYEVYGSTNNGSRTDMKITALGEIKEGGKTGTVTEYNAETGYFVLVNGTSRYYGYYADGILVVADSNGTTSFGTDAYFYFKDATTLFLTSANFVSWNDNKTRIINFTVDGESKIIYINDTEVYCDVDVVDATGNSVAISSALKTAGTVITIKKGATSIVTYGYVGDTFVLSDGYQGTYTASKDIGIGSIVLDGYGSATIGEAPVAYDLDSANSKITVVYNNRMYVLTLNKTTFTYSQVEDGYDGVYTMPDGTTKIQLGGYGAVTETDGNGTVTETTQTYVVSGSNITIYDGETSTTYGIDTEKKTLLGKSIFAGLTFTGTYSYWDEGTNEVRIVFADSPSISGTIYHGSGKDFYFNFTAEMEGNTITFTFISAVDSVAVNKELIGILDGNKITFQQSTASNKYSTNVYTFWSNGSVTCPDFGA